jgi:enamine deaminase RidA (YjgF/YER057c/UK114 family)
VKTLSLFAALALACRTDIAPPAPTPPPLPPPPPRAERFGAGVFSTDAWDFFVAFSPDERRALVGRADAAFEQFTLHETRRDAAGRWAAPTRPRFASAWSDADPHISPDGSKVFFISNRPITGSEPRAIHDIFVAELDAHGEWGEARRLPAPVNDGTADRWSPAVARSGNLYFGGTLAGTRGGSDLWVSRLVEGVYQPPENLGDAINTSAHEVEPWIAPDERYLIFAALRREGGAGGYDLFVSRRAGASWTPAVPLRAINTPESEWNHSVSPDGRWLYFAAAHDIYRIPLEDVMSDHRTVTIAPGGAYALAYEVTAPARTVYISGQIPTRADGSVPDGFEAQCRQVWANIDAALADAGMTRRDLVKVTTYLSDRSYRDTNSRIRREILGDHLPALTIIIAGIYDPAWLLEIEAIAAR